MNCGTILKESTAACRMPRSRTVGKPSFEWVLDDKQTYESISTFDQISENNLALTYRLNLQCKGEDCPSHSKWNPYCVMQGLKLNQWKTYSKNQVKSLTVDTLPGDELVLRKKGEICGMKNLGATCYVNSFIQCWFHFAPFRQAIFQWVPADDDDDNQSYEVTCCQSIQVVFAQLQAGIVKTVDTSAMVGLLGLNAGEMQDAQEFGVLVFSLLERVFQTSCSTVVHDFFPKNFSGTYVYVTKSTGRKKKLNNRIVFPENLDMAPYLVDGPDKTDDYTKYHLYGALVHYGTGANTGHYTAVLRINDKWVQLSDDNVSVIRSGNMMNCDMEKAQAPKGAKAERLEANVQGSRGAYMLVYLRTSTFPLSDMAKTINNSTPVKAGGSRKRTNNNQPVKLDQVEDAALFGEQNSALVPQKRTRQRSSESAVKQSQKSPSNDMFKMASTTIGNNIQMDVPCPSIKIEEVEVLDVDDGEFIADVDGMPSGLVQQIYKQNDEIIKSKHNESVVMEQIEDNATGVQQVVMEAAKLLHVDKRKKECYWIPVSWLVAFFNVKTDNSSRNNSQISIEEYLCPHKMLDFNQLDKVRLVSSEFIEYIIDHFWCFYVDRKEHKELLCKKCVFTEVKMSLFRNEMQETEKMLDSYLKSHCVALVADTPVFLLGKESKKTWMTMAESYYMKELNEDLVKQSSKGKLNFRQAHNPTDDANDSMPSTSGDVNESMHKMNVERKLNDDLICEHNQLIVDQSKMIELPGELWMELTKHFHSNNIHVFSELLERCAVCEVSEVEQQQRTNEMIKLAELDKNNFASLSTTSKRNTIVQFNKRALEDGPLYVVCAKFAKKYDDYIRKPQLNQRPTQICNDCLVCRHGKLIIQVADLDEADLKRFVTLTEGEWRLLSSMNFHVDFEVQCIVLPGERDEPVAGQLQSFPEYCNECATERLMDENSYRFVYNKSRFTFVQVEKKPENVEKGKDITETHSIIVSDDASSTHSDNDNKPIMQGFLESWVRPRRSSRHPMRRADHAEIMWFSSDETISDVCVKLMQKFNASPNDIHLFYQTNCLTDDRQLTLGQLEVPGESQIIVFIDETLGNIDEVMDLNSPTEETGFKGTALRG